jgi:hypothetical protein
MFKGILGMPEISVLSIICEPGHTIEGIPSGHYEPILGVANNSKRIASRNNN